MINKKAVFFGFFASAALLYAESTWTLDACLKQAKGKSLQLETAKLREQQADLSIEQAKTGNYPSLSASISNSLSDHPFVDGPKDYYHLSMGISGSYTVWDGGQTRLSIQQNQLNKVAAQHNTKQAERTIQESVLNAYINLLAATEKLRTANSSVELSQAELEYYGKLFDAGSITKKDLTQSQSNVLQKQVAKLTAELSVTTSKTTLRQLLELPDNEEFEIAAPEINIENPESLEALPSLQDLQKTIIELHPGLKSDSVNVQAATVSTQIAGKGKSIKVSLGANASTGLQAWESDRYGRQLKNGYNHSISLGVSIPIIDGGATANKVLISQVNESEKQIAIQEDIKSITNNIEKLYLNAVSADMQWKAAIMQVEAEKEAVKVAEEQRNAGAITYTELLTQKNNLESAQVTLVNAKYTSLLARKILDLYQGKLD